MERNIKELVAQLTLEEKAGLTSGSGFWYTKAVERLGIPSVMMTDGPHGLRKQTGQSDHLGLNDSVEAVCFPAACATASSFDTQLMEDMGATLGNECQAENVSILLGPGVCIKRSPLCGRNFEYMSEDPYLTGKLAAAYIRGVQSQNVGTSIKHFAANNQEFNRMSCSSEVSERALREIYLPGFEEAVKSAQPKTVMCSYNKINGVYASENNWLLNQVLREEWGFTGYVVTDWGAVADRVKGLAAGVDLEMPSSGSLHDQQVAKAVKEGRLEEAVLDKAVERMLKVLFSYVDNRKENAVFDRDTDHAKAVDYAAQCAVLLENNGVLPLKKESRVVYIGGFAENPRYQGGGSSHINASKVSSALGIARAKNRKVTYVPAFSTREDAFCEDGLATAVAAAKEAEVAVVFAGLPESFESEGYDRQHMGFPCCQNTLIAAVAAVNPNTVVVMHNGSPVECPWAESVGAILEMYLGGQGVGEACDQLLWGEANPCGRLAETFPLRLQDTPCYGFFPGDGKKVVYAEDVFVGYRWYDTREIPVRWAFGHGRSYTDFAYENLRLSSQTMADGDQLLVSVDVCNVGMVSGKEVVQLYVSDKNGTDRCPAKELKGFCKVALEPGERKTVTMKLTARDLSHWNEALGDWYAPSGSYGISVGHASDDIRLTTQVDFTTGKMLPLEVSIGSTLGALSEDPRTAGYTEKVLSDALGNSKLDMDDPSMSLMLAQMMKSMPIKTLPSFGMLPDTQVATIVEELAALAGER